MIVRDAEETVGRAIKSALAVVDEVVVVDTGSADNTRLIVEGYGARVVEHDWSDDFSAARNAGIEAAYGDWILVLDADEILESIRPVEVGRLLSNDAAIGYQV
jgi:glycosyltransferase involved in cell wall biosynthesis